MLLKSQLSLIRGVILCNANSYMVSACNDLFILSVKGNPFCCWVVECSNGKKKLTFHECKSLKAAETKMHAFCSLFFAIKG